MCVCICVGVGVGMGVGVGVGVCVCVCLRGFCVCVGFVYALCLSGCVAMHTITRSGKKLSLKMCQQKWATQKKNTT